MSKNSNRVDKGRYQCLVGKLIYLAHTRPDITSSVSCVSQFMHAPSEAPMEAVYRILRYLKGLQVFKKIETRNVEVFIDAANIDRRSISGYSYIRLGQLSHIEK